MKKAKKKLRHHARFHARRLLQMEEAKGLSVSHFLNEGKPFVEIVRTITIEKVDLVFLGRYGGQTGKAHQG